MCAAIVLDDVVGVADVQFPRWQRRISVAIVRCRITAGRQDGYYRFGFRDAGKGQNGDGWQVQEAKAQDAKAPNAKAPETKPAGTAIPLDGQPSGAERAILERLQERRQELDARARELDIRESLIQAAEKRMEGQLTELKETEQHIKDATQQRDDADAARFKGLVTMYENMKPRDAAKIFDRLDIGVLIEIASKIKPQVMSDIMAQMSPDIAQRLTVELASKAQDSKQAKQQSERSAEDPGPADRAVNARSACCVLNPLRLTPWRNHPCDAPSR